MTDPLDFIQHDAEARAIARDLRRDLGYYIARRDACPEWDDENRTFLNLTIAQIHRDLDRYNAGVTY